MPAESADEEETLTVDDYLLACGASDATIATYRRTYRRLESPDYLGKPLQEATKRDVLRLKQKLRPMRVGHQYANLLRMFYNAADRKDLSKLLHLRQHLKVLSPDEVLTVVDINQLIRYADSIRDRALVIVLWNTGSRIHEILAVRLRDVVPLQGGTFGVFFRKAKVDGEQHTAYVIEGQDHLAAWLKVHPRRKDPDAPLFISVRSGGPLHRDAALKILKRSAKRAGIQKNVYSHLFRHSRATELLRRGMTEAQVKKLLGWKPNSAMLSRYSHLADKDAYAALLRAHDMEMPEPVEIEKILTAEDDLAPVLPMFPAPGANYQATAPEQVAASVDDLTEKVEGLQEVFRLLVSHPEVASALAKATSETVEKIGKDTIPLPEFARAYRANAGLPPD